MYCVYCDGKGCESCNGTGDTEIKGCPNTFCSDVVPAIELIELFHKGLPPVSGGVLDQANWFIEAARQLKRDEAAIG